MCEIGAFFVAFEVMNFYIVGHFVTQKSNDRDRVIVI